MDIRDRYIAVSRQRLEDNAANYDGKFNPAKDSTSPSTASDEESSSPPLFERWNIYPSPPQRHWDPSSAKYIDTASSQDPFDTKKAHDTPSPDSCVFSCDDKGVFQVYADNKELEASKPLFDVPTIKEYFLDLEYILGVISDGPAKSFAWRRLNYLESKWEVYSHLNEYQELAEMKVRRMNSFPS